MYSILAAALLDAIAGDPYWFPHPVRLIGRYIRVFEKGVFSCVKSAAGLRTAGILLTLSTVLLSYFSVSYLLKLADAISPWLYHSMNIVVMYTCLASRCLRDEALRIYKLLLKGDLLAARHQTSMIVGRDTDKLDERELTRAVVETVSENSSDGVIAPLVFMAIGGAPLAIAYKAVNTLDSMVGYRNERYLYFGWCSAKLDDIVNYIPARLTAVLISLAAVFIRLDIASSIRTAIKDGSKHSSPNSGYPEAAAAGALGIMLGGTNLYFGKPVYKPTIGNSRRPIEPQDIVRTVKLMLGSYIILICLIATIYFGR